MQQIFVTAPFGGIWRCEFEKKLVWYASVWQISFSRLYKSKQASYSIKTYSPFYLFSNSFVC
jgi:hypothetical protein